MLLVLSLLFAVLVSGLYSAHPIICTYISLTCQEAILLLLLLSATTDTKIHNTTEQLVYSNTGKRSSVNKTC